MKNIETGAKQSIITFYDDYIEKEYKKDLINSFSSIEHEIKIINIFSCKYSPKILSVDKENNSYKIKRYDIPFGTRKNIIEKNIKRILYTITYEELYTQLNEIKDILDAHSIHHKDINPGNLIFSEKERVIKLIDFYWAITPTEKTGIPDSGINQVYGIDDKKAFQKIKDQIKIIYETIKESLKIANKQIEDFGVVYHNGSSKHKGKSYSPINIPYFKGIPFHRDISNEYKEIVENLTLKPTTALDIGCSTGFSTFSLIRDFSIDTIIGYEADPQVYLFLKNIKQIFCLDNISFIDNVSPQTIFPKSDLIICMNVHMWLHKIYDNKCDTIIKNLINSSKEMFFQTAGLESNGMYLVKELTSKEVIKDYLLNLGSKNVDFIRSTNYHGGLRHLFKIY